MKMEKAEIGFVMSTTMIILGNFLLQKEDCMFLFAIFSLFFLMIFCRNEFRDVDDEIPSKKTLQSQVFSTSWEPKQRDQVLEEQKKDKSSFLRNKRMFGFLMKTLETFKNEESHRPELVCF